MKGQHALEGHQQVDDLLTKFATGPGIQLFLSSLSILL
jgi:hypothetical protein